MPYDRSDRIRRAAILVASLDEPLAEQLLADLPPAEAARVLNEAEALESIDPEEQRDVLAEFRRLTRGRGSAPMSPPVEFSYSSGSEMSTEALNQAPSTSAAEAAPASLSDADAASMAELLAGEHPQIVAAALARLPEDHSAAVFSALPPEVQSQALERLASLAPVDEDAIVEIETQLQQRLQQRRDHEARTAAGAALVHRILARTSESQRTYLLGRMSAKDGAAEPTAPKLQPAPLTPAFAAPPGGLKNAYADAGDAHDPVALQAIELASAVRRAQASGAYQHLPLTDRTEELEALSNESLVRGLQAAGEPTVLRALAASGEGFLKRVTGMLPRKQAKQLRRMLRDLGPTRLADLHEAQHRLLELAYESMTVEAA